MADNTIQLSSEGVGPFVDNELIAGSSANRQRIVIAGNSSAALAYPLAATPTTGLYALPVRLTPPSSTVVLGVSPSSNWSLGASSAVVIGAVSPSSNWSLGASSGTVIGSVVITSGVVTLTSGTLTLGTIFITSGTTGDRGSTANPVIGSLSSGAAQIGVLGPSSANVIGLIGQSSALALSSGTVTLTSGTLTIGALSSQAVQIGTVALTSGTLTLGTLTTGTAVGLSTVVNYIEARSTAGALATSFGAFFQGAQVVVAGNPTAQTSGNIIGLTADRAGRLIVKPNVPRQAVTRASLITAANTSQQQLIAAPGASLVNDLIFLTAWSSQTPSTTLVATNLSLYSSCGQADPGIWTVPINLWPGAAPIVLDWDMPLPQATANNGWFVVSSSSTVVVHVDVEYLTGAT